MKSVFAAALIAVAVAPGLSRGQDLEVAHCKFPAAPELADGASATEDQMVDAATAVRGFVESMQASLACIDDVQAGLGEGITKEQKAKLNALYNNGVDQMNAIAEGYNAQVRAFKAAN